MSSTPDVVMETVTTPTQSSSRKRKAEGAGETKTPVKQPKTTKGVPEVVKKMKVLKVVSLLTHLF